MDLALDNYVSFLEQVKQSLLVKSATQDFSKLTGDEWETWVFEEALLVNEEERLGWKILNTKAAEFPDIVINDLFGVEVKATKDDHWTTLGNSINESKRISSVEHVYFFFGKLGGSVEILYKPYEKCLKNIATTHYPRYIVDMMLPEGMSIFDKLGISYNEYRLLSGDERIKLIKAYLRQTFEDGEALWWIDDTTPPVIKNFNRFHQGTKREFTILAMARCPEIFKGSRERGKYDRVAQMLLTEYQAVSGNLRDHFSASGIVEIALSNGKKYSVPQMIYQLHKNSKEIRDQILKTPDETLSEDWGLERESNDKVAEYAALLNAIGSFAIDGIGTGDFFLDGLNA